LESFGYTAFPGRTFPVGTVEQEEGAGEFPYQTVNIKTGRRCLRCSFETDFTSKRQAVSQPNSFQGYDFGICTCYSAKNT